MRPKDIIPEATKYNIEPAALWAIILTESAGSGFLSERYPWYSTITQCPKNADEPSLKILFERHIMWKRLLARGISPAPLNRENPALCGPTWNRSYYQGGLLEYNDILDIYNWASLYDHERRESYRKAALESASWGLFQIMGFNYKACGFENVDNLIIYLQQGETSQVEVILKWIKAVGLLDNLQRKDWVGFSRGYNGPGQIPIYAPRLYLNYLNSKKYFK